MRAEIQFEEDPEDVPEEGPGPKVVHRYTPPPDVDNPRASVALECGHCRKITWVFSDQPRSRCGRCGLWFFNQAGKWMNRAQRLKAKVTPNPKE